ncbi:MAG: hypothetical protein HYZ42_10290 [Bacteroidetes bacterium]|nr:hypothetical protein [Bacteroidota bacterium]
MTKTEVKEQLGLGPYNIKSFNDTSHTFIYVYRLVDRRTVLYNTKPINGREAIGKYVQLAVTYAKNDQLLLAEFCTTCPEILVTTSKLDLGKIVVFMTVTFPVILIYLGLKE